MKKTLIILSIIGISFLTSVVFTSCKKETNPLTGTTWKGSYSYPDEGYRCDYTMIFTSDVSVDLKTEVYNYGSYDYGDFLTGTYTYSEPTVRIKEDGYELCVGTVNGKTMTVNFDEGEFIVPFTKQ